MTQTVPSVQNATVDECLSIRKEGIPCVFNGMLASWEASRWTPAELRRRFGTVETVARLHPKTDDPVWETQCVYARTSLGDFVDWIDGKATQSLSPFGSSSDMWGYIDYKHIKSIFDGRLEDVVGAGSWRAFGVDMEGLHNSTLWVGSQGAVTTAHYDSYSSNLIAQVFGRKRWVLYPPSATAWLSPTRLPYEESSVFSAHGSFMLPELRQIPELEALRMAVTLEPGQVLYLPKHWWHCVASDEGASISINQWLPDDTDHIDRMDEAVVRMLVAKFKGSDGQTSATSEEGEVEQPSWLNPTETLYSSQENEDMLSVSAEAVLGRSVTTDDLLKAVTHPRVLRAIRETLAETSV